MRESIIGKTFKSKNYGYFEVVEKTSTYVENIGYLYKIKFINTGYEAEYKTNNIKMGKVRDKSVSINKKPPSERSDLTGKTFNIPHKGDILVLNRVKSEDSTIRYKVKFLKTGEEGIYAKQRIITGQIGENKSRKLYAGKIFYDRYELVTLIRHSKYVEMHIYKIHDKVLNNTFEMSGEIILKTLHKIKWIEVIDLEGNKEYIYNYAQYAKNIGGTRQGVQLNLSGKVKSYKGYKFKYVD